MSDSITITREQVEREMLGWLEHEGFENWRLRAALDQHKTKLRKMLAKSFTTALFNGALAREEANRKTEVS